ncbi:MAG: cache domain-containing protein, partial [Lachnospiraceae bacterium]|nr:cache domain-containing protein [Lachnospiraceae bacterium]
MKKEQKVRFSIKARLLLIALLPPIGLSIILTLMASNNIRLGMQEEAFAGLRGIAWALEEVYASTDSGDYIMDESGNVFKGDLAVSGNYDIVDHIKQNTDFDVTIFYGDTRVTTSLINGDTGERLVGTTAAAEVVQAVLNEGKEYSDASIVINNQPYYGYYVPITQNGAVVGMAFAGTPSTDVDAFITQKIIPIMIVSIVVLLIVIAIGLFFALNLSSAIIKAANVISEMGNGNLAVTVDSRAKKRSDETGVMTRELEGLINKLAEAIGQVKESSQVLYTSGTSLEQMASQSSSTTDEISRAVEDVSKGATNQAEETETASHSIDHMGTVITEIVASVDTLGKASLDMKNASDESSVIINELSISNDKTSDAIEKIGKQVYSTNDSVQEILKAVELITSIASETNLLSLNASIEAARAGEHGRGFAVVASEIQKLAEESNRSAQEIQQIIDSLLKESETTVQVMNEVDIIMKEQHEKLAETKEKFQLVIDGVTSTRNEAEIIQRQTDECDQARAKIMDVVQNLSAISEENAASSQETTASMEELNAMLNLLAESSKELLDLSTKLEADV